MTIKTLTKSDVAKIANMVSGNDYSKVDICRGAFRPQTLYNFIIDSSKYTGGFVVFGKNDLTAIILFEIIDYGKTLYIHYVCARKNRRQLGTKLVKKVEAYAKKNKIDNISLQSENDRFWKKMKYTIIKGSKGFGEPDPINYAYKSVKTKTIKERLTSITKKFKRKESDKLQVIYN
jgi:hypothetical protein